MSSEEVYEIPLSVFDDAVGQEVPVTVRFRVQDGNITAIEAVSNNQTYVGTLTLHPRAGVGPEGGDECIICDPRCRVVVPCPDQP